MEVGVGVKGKPWGKPTQGQKTPSMTMREIRARRVVGPMMDRDFFEFDDDGVDAGNGFENGFWRLLLWCRNDDIFSMISDPIRTEHPLSVPDLN